LRRRGWLLVLVAAVPFARGAGAEGPAAPARVDNVLIVTFDGFRWQELFGGYDDAYNTRNDGGVAVAAQEALKARFDRATPVARARRSCLSSGRSSRARARSSATRRA
jgi:hypothetical protein